MNHKLAMFFGKGPISNPRDRIVHCENHEHKTMELGKVTQLGKKLTRGAVGLGWL